MINEGTIKQIRTWAPLVGGGAAAWYIYRQEKKIDKAILFGLLAAVVSWLVARAATNAITSFANKPGQVLVTPDRTGDGSGNTGNWDPAGFAAELKADIYSMGLRNQDLYARMALLSNSQLEMIYNYWSANFFGEDQETLIQAMAGEWYGWSGPQVAANAQNIMDRLKALGHY